MKTEIEWLEEKIKEYESSPIETLSNILYNTTYLIKQFNNSPGSLAALRALKNCIEPNIMFIKYVNRGA